VRELPAYASRENLKETKMIEESVGHIRFWGNFEYLEFKGILLEAPWKNRFDPDGIRYGALSHDWLRSMKDKRELIRFIEELVEDHNLIWYIPDQEKHLYKTKIS
jgi:hypothetical protein